MRRKRPASAPASALSPREMLRWIWTQLTSMRTALILLLLLAVASLPGSFIPQRRVDSRAALAFQSRNPEISPWLDRLGLFDVYSSSWFSAIYLLLTVSLIGCIVPRSRIYLRALRARPPRAPRRFSRLPASGSFTTSADVDEVLAAARGLLRRSRVDVVIDEGPGGPTGELRAERGYLRELGNLVFHVSVVAVLVGVALGSLVGYRGAVIVTEGETYSNALTQFDEFAGGVWFDPKDLPPFSLELDDMIAQFDVGDGPQRGAPRLFEANGSYRATPDGPTEEFSVRVNNPLAIGSTSVFLVGQGYSPVITVTDPEGNVVFDEAVPFLPEGPTYTSGGVVKVPDAKPQQIGMQGFFLPTAARTSGDQPSVSIFPAAANPYVALQVWTGDLGLDDGMPQSVYVLDKSRLTQVLDENGEPFRIELQPGQEMTLPDGTIVAFSGLRQFARFQIASTPLAVLPLVGVSVGLGGLVLSLFVRPRRIWVRAKSDGTMTYVEAAALDRVPRDELPDDLSQFVARLREAVDERAED